MSLLIFTIFCQLKTLQVVAEQRIRDRLDLQDTMRQQLMMKEHKKQSERKEEEEFRQQVFACFTSQRKKYSYTPNRITFFTGFIIIL